PPQLLEVLGDLVLELADVDLGLFRHPSLFNPDWRVLSRLLPAPCGSPALPAAAGPPAGRRGPMAMPPRRKRDLLSPLAGLRLLPRLCPEHLHFRARQFPHLAGAHPGDGDPTVIGPMELLYRRSHRLHQPLDQVR